MRNGVNPSLVWLPVGSWTTVLEFFKSRFPDVSQDTWIARMLKGEVQTKEGVCIQPDSHYRSGMCLYYYRELPDEARIPFHEQILFETEHLLVVDKPHFLPVTPAGGFLQETLLTRLRNRFNNAELSPIHRLDRETAGVILFAKDRPARAQYQQLFANHVVQKTYHALAPNTDRLTFPTIRRSRLIEAEQFFVMHEVEGVANTETEITLLESRAHLSLYQLKPLTGKKHQLRVHMAALGIPILNDRFYPVALPEQLPDYDNPLKLLAKRIQLMDPYSNTPFEFESLQSL